MAKQENNSKIKEIMNDKKKRGRMGWVIFLVILAILFVINNLNGEEGPGPYPPDYWKLKKTANVTAPEFTLKSIEGSDVSLGNYKGKVILLEFWAAGNISCQKMTPELIKIKEKYKKYDFEIISISVDHPKNNSDNELKNYVENHKINYPVLIGDEMTDKTYRSDKDVPIIYIIKKDGKIYNRHDGWTPTSILERDITLLLK